MKHIKAYENNNINIKIKSDIAQKNLIYNEIYKKYT